MKQEGWFASRLYYSPYGEILIESGSGICSLVHTSMKEH
jgi:hypothetical protein